MVSGFQASPQRAGLSRVQVKCLNGQFYRFEFKVVEWLPEGKAPQQDVRIAAIPTRTAPRVFLLHGIGGAFSRARSSMVGFEVEDEDLAGCLKAMSAALPVGVVRRSLSSVSWVAAFLVCAGHRVAPDPTDRIR